MTGKSVAQCITILDRRFYSFLYRHWCADIQFHVVHAEKDYLLVIDTLFILRTNAWLCDEGVYH